VPSFEVSSASPANIAVDLLILPVYEGREPGPGVKEVGAALGGDLMAAMDEHHVRGKVGDVLTVPTMGRLKAKSVLLVGVGPRAQAGPAAIRKASMKAARLATKFASVATTLPQAGGAAEESAHAFAEGMTLGSYRFDRYKERPIDDASKEKNRLKRVTVLGGPEKSVKAGLRRGQIYGDAANWARDLVNTPAIDATPDFLGQEAKKMAAKHGLDCKVWTKAELKRGGFGGILGVGSGSANDPRLIELAYNGGGSTQAIGLTGKGVTFDSGGLSLKDAGGMEWMKADMGGAAAALATMRAIAQLKPKVNVIAAIPSSENMPGGSAIRPGDVLRHRGGKTSEVLNTDAEGRLILADALAYLAEKKPRVILDSATLTGAAMVALGNDIWAVMGTDSGLIEELITAGKEEGEPGWELPLWADYRRNIESSVADVKNTGPRWGGAINAGLFLKEFVGDVPWAHLDVAGTAFTENGTDYWPKGATGSPARTFIRYIEAQGAKNGAQPVRKSAASSRSSSRGRSSK
jgi:leucyl aminopeptidase